MSAGGEPHVRFSRSVWAIWITLLITSGTIGLVLNAPAQAWSPILSSVTGQQLSCLHWSGSLWRARCEGLVWRDPTRGQRNEIGSLGLEIMHLRISPLSLIAGLGWRRADSWLQATLTIKSDQAQGSLLEWSQLRGEIDLETLRASLPSIVWRRLGTAGQTRGTLSVALDQLILPPAHPPCARGILQWQGLQHPSWPAALGPMQLDIGGDCPLPTGSIKDLGGPLQIALQFGFDRPDRLSLQGDITPRPASLGLWQPLLSTTSVMTPQGSYRVDLSLEWQP